MQTHAACRRMRPFNVLPPGVIQRPKSALACARPPSHAKQLPGAVCGRVLWVGLGTSWKERSFPAGRLIVCLLSFRRNSISAFNPRLSAALTKHTAD